MHINLYESSKNMEVRVNVLWNAMFILLTSFLVTVLVFGNDILYFTTIAFMKSDKYAIRLQQVK